MTRRQYKKLGCHWSVLDGAQRPWTNSPHGWAAAYANIAADERRINGDTHIYRRFIGFFRAQKVPQLP